MKTEEDWTRLPWESLDDRVRIDAPESGFHHVEVKVGRLIAAAPDLLAALEEIVEYRGNWFTQAICERAAAAIAKATGEAR